MRRRLTDKLARLPLGIVLSRHQAVIRTLSLSGVDATETTLAYPIPEFTAEIFGPDYCPYCHAGHRLAADLAVSPINSYCICYIRMAANSEADYQNTWSRPKTQ